MHLQATEHVRQPEAGRKAETHPPLVLSEGPGPADTHSDFWPQKRETMSVTLSQTLLRIWL